MWKTSAAEVDPTASQQHRVNTHRVGDRIFSVHYAVFWQKETLSPLEHVPRALLVSTVPAAATPAYARSLHLAVQQTFVYPIATLPHRAVNTRSQATGIVL